MNFMKETRSGRRWYHKDYFGFGCEAHVYEDGDRLFAWSIHYIGGAKIAEGKAVSLKQAEFLCDQAIRDANLAYVIQDKNA